MSKKLLLADDSITIQKVIQITFAHEDYDLTITDNGDAALDKAREIKPDLILADVYMPGKDGYALSSAVKQDPDLRNTTVLLLTGSFEPFDEEKAKLCQADAWIEKPFESQALIDKVEELLTAAAASETEEPISEEDLQDESQAMEKEALVDFDQALKETDDEFADFSFEEEPISPEVALSDKSEGSSWSVAEVDEPPMETEETEELTFEGEPFPVHEMESPQADEFEESGLSDGSGEKSFEDEEDNVFASAPIDWQNSEDAESQPEVVGEAFGDEEGEASAVEFAAWQDYELEDAESAQGLDDVTLDDEDEEVLALQDEDILETEDLEPVLNEQTLASWSRDQSPYEETRSEQEEGFDTPPSEALEHLDEKEETLTHEDDHIEPMPDQTPEEEILEEQSVVMSAGEPSVNSELGVSSLSEKDMEEIVERVAQKVVEGLAGSILEKIAWEVVPDLAESLIREEIRKIKEAVV